MKKLFFLTGILLAGYLGFGQMDAKSIVKITPSRFDFGRIKQRVPAECFFVIINIRKAPVIVERSWGSCGCATPDRITKPIMPGDSAKLKVVYDAETIGSFTKTIFIQIAGADQPATVQIAGVVMHPVLYDKEKKKPVAGRH